jgi:hypothetical protein
MALNLRLLSMNSWRNSISLAIATEHLDLKRINFFTKQIATMQAIPYYFYCFLLTKASVFYGNYGIQRFFQVNHFTWRTLPAAILEINRSKSDICLI